MLGNWPPINRVLQPSGSSQTKGCRPDQPNYRPVFLKLPFLLGFAVYLAALLGVLEWSCQRLPTSDDDQSVPEGPIPEGRLIFHTAPLVHARDGIITPVPTQWKRLPRRSSTERQTGFQDVEFEMTRVTYVSQEDSGLRAHGTKGDGVNSTARRPTAFLGGREGLPPSYLRDFGLGFGLGSDQRDSFNITRGWNSSVADGKVRKRAPAKGSFGQLSGPIVGILIQFEPPGYPYAENWDAFDAGIYGGSSIYFTTADWWDMSNCSVNIPPDGGAYGVATCNGPSLVFHDDACWDLWAKAAEKEKRLAGESAEPWPVFESVLFFEPDRPKEMVQHCEGPPMGKDLDAIYAALAASAELTNQTPTDIVLRNEGGSATATVPAREVVETQTDSTGHVTVVTRLEALSVKPARPGVTLVTERDAQGVPTTTFTAQIITYTDSNGVPVATSTRPVETLQTLLTERDANGKPTRTRALNLRASQYSIPTGSVVITTTNSNGHLTTITAAPRQIKEPLSFSKPSQPRFYILSHTDYYLLLFLPVFLTVLASILAEMVSSNLHALLSFQQMAKPNCASARESLLFPRGIWEGFIFSVRLARRGEPLSLLSQGMVLISAVITALSSEAVGIGLGGSCMRDNYNGCYMEVAIFLPPARALEGLLVVDLGIVLVIALLMRESKWRSGVKGPQGSVVATAELARNEVLRWLFRGIGEGGEGVGIGDQVVLKKLASWRFGLGSFKDWKGESTYGVIPRVEWGVERGRATGFGGVKRLRTALGNASSSTFSSISRVQTQVFSNLKTPSSMHSKERMMDFCGLFFMLGLLVLIVYYNTTSNTHTPFERFMNEQSFGVRVLFTALGVLLTFFWDHYYMRTVTLEPYRLLSQPNGASVSALFQSPPTTVFVGVFASLRRGESFSTLVALSNILFKFVPILLSNIPFSPIQTWELHLACAWGTVGSLAATSLVVVWGMGMVKYPDMPMDPGSLAGRVYYLCDADEAVREGVLECVESGMGEKSRGGKQDERSYGFGVMIGVSGMRGIGVFVKEREWVREGRDEKVQSCM